MHMYSQFLFLHLHFLSFDEPWQWNESNVQFIWKIYVISHHDRITITLFDEIFFYSFKFQSLLKYNKCVMRMPIGVWSCITWTNNKSEWNSKSHFIDHRHSSSHYKYILYCVIDTLSSLFHWNSIIFHWIECSVRSPIIAMNFSTEIFWSCFLLMKYLGHSFASMYFEKIIFPIY